VEHRSRVMIKVCIAALAAFLMGCLIGSRAFAQEPVPDEPPAQPEQPAAPEPEQPPPPQRTPFDAEQKAEFTIFLSVPDVKKLEAKAISVLKKNSKFTLAQAQHEVRKYGEDGKSYRTLVSRCLQVVSDDSLRKVAVLGVQKIWIGNSNVVPETGPENVPEPVQ
jgi:hypothetical protein